MLCWSKRYDRLNCLTTAYATAIRKESAFSLLPRIQVYPRKTQSTREDAQQIGFDEGPVFPTSYQYLEERGMAIVRGVQREAARTVIEAYAVGGGLIHNRQD